MRKRCRKQFDARTDVGDLGAADHALGSAGADLDSHADLGLKPDGLGNVADDAVDVGDRKSWR